MATESTNQVPTCHPTGKWIVAANGSAFCSVCGRGLNAPLKIETPMPEVSFASTVMAEPAKPEPAPAPVKEPEPLVPRDPLLVEREKTHGSFKKNAAIFKRLTRAIGTDSDNITDESQYMALVMLMAKISRAVQNPMVKEHWDDIAGYANLAGEACSE